MAGPGQLKPSTVPLLHPVRELQRPSNLLRLSGGKRSLWAAMPPAAASVPIDVNDAFPSFGSENGGRSATMLLGTHRR
jgi:hypothetical protein